MKRFQLVPGLSALLLTGAFTLCADAAQSGARTHVCGGPSDTVPPSPTPPAMGPGTYPGPGGGGGTGGGTGGGAGGGVPGPGARWPGAPGSYQGSGTGWGWTSGLVPHVSLDLGGPFEGRDPTEWDVFWRLRSEPWIDVRGALARGAVLTGSDEYFIGRGERAVAQRSPRPTREEIDELVVPALLEALADGDDSTELVGGALVALAKLGAGSVHRAAIERAILPRLSSGNREVAELATVALGILGGRTALPTLRALALDDDAGRALVRRSEVRTRTRALAAYGLALVGRESEDELVRRTVVRDLVALASAPEAGVPDLAVAALIGIGLVPLERVSAGEDPVELLLELAGDRRRSPVLRAHAVGSLGRLAPRLDEARRDASRALATLALRPRASERDAVRQAWVLAAPELFEDADDETRTALADALGALADDGDLMSRRFAWIALGRLGGQAARGSGTAERIEARFEAALRRAGANRERPWVALGCGLLAKERLERDELSSRRLAGLLRGGLADAGAPTDAAAFACALGLARDVDAEDALVEVIERFADDEARSRAAVALGMLDGTRPVEVLRPLFDVETHRVGLLHDAATGLALMGDAEAVPTLSRRLGEARALVDQLAWAVALGGAGDRRALEPLLELLASREATPAARGAAAAALGRVADPRPVPWNACVAEHLNYVAVTDTLSNGRGTGLLDVR